MDQDNSAFLNFLFFETTHLKRLNLLWFGFVIYTLSYALFTTTLVNPVACQVVQSIGLSIILVAAVPLIKFNIENEYLRFLFILYFCWLFILLIRGFTFDYIFLKSMLFDASFGILFYLTPLILLFPKKLVFYRQYFDIIIILGIFYVLFDALFIKNILDSDIQNITSQGIIDYFTKTLSIPCGFILLTYIYHSKKRNLLAICVVIISVLLLIIRARRALLLLTFGIVILSYIVFICKTNRKFIPLLLGLVVVLAVAFYGVSVFNHSQLFDSVKARGLADTRTDVEIAFFVDMKVPDWIIGKGISGKYFCPGIDSPEAVYRTMIETDYLQIILKGGIISLILLLLITVPAVIKGIFYSKNMLSKAAGIWVLLWLLCLYPINVTTFTLSYLLVWISVGICYSKEIRNIPEEVMRLYFSFDVNELKSAKVKVQ